MEQLNGSTAPAVSTKKSSSKVEDDEVDIPMVLSFLGAWAVEAEKAGLEVKAGEWGGSLLVMIDGATYAEFLAANGGA